MTRHVIGLGGLTDGGQVAHCVKRGVHRSLRGRANAVAVVVVGM